MSDGAPVSSPVPPPVSPPPASNRPGGISPRPPGVFGARDEPEGGGPRMGFMDHLMELRRRLWVSVVSILVCMIVSLAFYGQLVELLRAPMDAINAQYAARPDFPEMLKRLDLPPDSKVLSPIISTTMLGTMMTVMWLGILTGLLLSSPIITYEVWSFVAPGLKEKERRAIRPVLFGGILFFVFGCGLAYYVLFPVTLQFVIWLNVELGFRPNFTVDDYMSLVLNMMAITGLICEAPLVVGVLAKLGLVKASHLTRYWRMCVLGAFIFGSIFSPGTDVISMLVFTALLLSIYLVSILFAYMFYSGEEKKA